MTHVRYFSYSVFFVYNLKEKKVVWNKNNRKDAILKLDSGEIFLLEPIPNESLLFVDNGPVFITVPSESTFC